MVFLRKQQEEKNKNIRMSLLLHKMVTDKIWEKHKVQ